MNLINEELVIELIIVMLSNSVSFVVITIVVVTVVTVIVGTIVITDSATILSS